PEGDLPGRRSGRRGSARDPDLGEVAVRRRGSAGRVLLCLSRRPDRPAGQPRAPCRVRAGGAARVLHRDAAELVPAGLSPLRDCRRPPRATRARLAGPDGGPTRRARPGTDRSTARAPVRRARSPRSAPPGAIPRSCARGLLEPMHDLPFEGGSAPRRCTHRRRLREEGRARGPQRAVALLYSPPRLRPGSRRYLAGLHRARLEAAARRRRRSHARPLEDVPHARDRAAVAPDLAPRSRAAGGTVRAVSGGRLANVWSWSAYGPRRSGSPIFARRTSHNCLALLLLGSCLVLEACSYRHRDQRTRT